MNEKIQKILEEFDEWYGKNILSPGFYDFSKIKDIEQVKKIKQFLSSSLRKIAEESVEESKINIKLEILKFCGIKKSHRIEAKELLEYLSQIPREKAKEWL